MRDLFPVLRVLGMLMCMFALAMALPGAVSWWQQESVWRVYPLSMAVTMGAGLLLWWLLRHHRQDGEGGERRVALKKTHGPKYGSMLPHRFPAGPAQ